MWEHIAPEECGVSSARILDYIKTLDDNRLATHDVIIARGDKILYESYWAPFDADFKHRMYSVSKSFVTLAVGFLYTDGKIDLDRSICDYFPEYVSESTHRNLRGQTVRNMLMMSTSSIERSWFAAKPADRVKFYFDNVGTDCRPAGTLYTYDSPGTFVVGALVEKLAGMSFIDYLKEKLFRKLGVSEDIDCLLCPGGHAWSDSAILCRPTDLLKVMRFTANRGEWQGEQLIDRDFMEKATSKQIDNCLTGFKNYDTHGYGYYIWMTQDGGFSFNGMGSQFAIYAPEKDMILIYNGDNQGNPTSGKLANKLIFDCFFNIIVKNADEKLADIEAGRTALAEYSENCRLKVAWGEARSHWAEKISGKTFEMFESNSKISRLRFDFSDDGGVMTYVKDGKEMSLPFGMSKNVFSLFPEEGYADRVGTVAGDRLYKCAASAAWIEPHKLLLNCQIIDTYFGNFQMSISFTEDGQVGAYIEKHAEDFLHGYDGYLAGKC